MLSGTSISRVSRALAAAVCAIGGAAALPAVATASTRGVRVGAPPFVPAAARPLGVLPATAKLRVTVALAPRDPAALAAFASAVSTPGSALYRDYITPAEFARRFGPTAAQIASVRASLRAHGLTPGPASANGLGIPVAATAGSLGRALSISFSRLLAPDGHVAFASTAAPLFDAHVARLVQGVVGLDTISAPAPLDARPLATPAATALIAPHVATGGPQPCAAATSAAPGLQAYTADQIASAYGFAGLYGAGDFGAGQTVAVYELESDDPNDIASYQACYGTSAPVSYVPIDGGVPPGPGTGEAALDIEDLIGLVPKANFIVYQGPNSNSGAPGSGPYDTYNAIISQDRAKVIATSWGQCEPMQGSADAAAEATLFEEAAAQGQTIVSAAGDNGAEDCFTPGQNLATQPAVDDPASQPYVTGVGGTSLSVIGPPPTETVWNNGGGLQALLGSSAGAGGGGVSTIWKMPDYQAGAPAALHVVNGGSTPAPCGASSGYCREVPDVSADADPYTGYLIFYEGTWSGIGGTSAASPVWSALVTLANASAACNGATVGFANPALYRVASGGQYPTYFHDVTAGNNDFTGTNGGQYAAGAGYDMASGLGSPIASALAVPLCETVTVTNPGPQVSTLGRHVSVHVIAADAANATLTYRAVGLPPGLSIDHATGVVAGKPKRTGTYTVHLSATDTGGRTSNATFAWRVRALTVLSSSPALRRCGGRPRTCTFSASRGQAVAARPGHRTRVALYLFTSTGGAVARAVIAVKDGRRTFDVRTGGGGQASFLLAKGPSRSVRAAYAGGVGTSSTSLTFRVRSQ